MFLKSLSEYQQRAEIGRLAFSERWSGSSLQEDILKDQTVVTFSETLGINPRFWEFQLRHYAEEPDVIGAPVFRADQCLAPFSFHYEHLNHNLAISGIIYIDDDQSAMIGTLTCSSIQEKSRCAKAAGPSRNRFRHIENRWSRCGNVAKNSLLGLRQSTYAPTTPRRDF